jgi:Na+-transporting NADH:ubiquinone oxidoreductase subunit B
MAESKKGKSLIMKQKPMLQVVYALVPLVFASIYFFGWRTLLVLAVVNIAGFLSEYLFARVNNKPVTSAVFVSNFLFALSLPPGLPLWMAAVGIIFGVVFGKMVFGGFGMNVFNPAISGRAFLYISFVVPMTGSWVNPVGGVAGGFTAFQADAVTQATPLAMYAEGETVPLLDLFLGNISGSMGETAAFLIIIAGLYLMIKKVANFRVVIGGFIGFLLFQIIFWLAGISAAVDPVTALLSGSFLFAVMFNITDPVSASQRTDLGRWIYGFMFGSLVVLIRLFSTWPEGTTFAILIINMFAPLLDRIIRETREARKAKAKGAEA